MKKLNDYEGGDWDSINSSIDVGSACTDERSVRGAEKYGLCGSCAEFQFAESEFDVFHARCKKFSQNLSESRPIKRCTNYSKVGEMSLWDMKEIAWLIDKVEKEIKGFRQ